MKQLISLLAPAAVAGLLAWLLTPVSAWLAAKLGAIDRPGPRRVHDRPIPRLGGLAVVGATVMVLAAGAAGLPGAPRWLAHPTSLGIFAGLVPVLLIAVRDDMAHVGAGPKFAVHALGASIAMWFGVVLPSTVHLFGLPIHLGWLAVPISAAWIIGVTNAFNLVDGLDGLAGGLGLISAASLAIVMVLAHKPENAAAAIVLGGAIIGFLPFNLHPARVFLGDTGATAIGFLLGCFALTSSTLLSAGFATLIPVAIVGVPIADAFVSIIRRTIGRFENGEGNRVYEADRNHIHHRLLLLGLSHRRAVWLLYGIGSGLSLVALASLLLTYSQAGLLLLGILIAGFVGINRLGYGEFAFIRRGVALRAYDLPVMRWSFFVVFVDIVLIGLALYLAIALKLDNWLLAGKRNLVFWALALLVPTHVAMFVMFGVYRGSWRLAGVYDFLKINLAILSASLLSIVFAIVLSIPGLSPSLCVVFAFIEISLATGSRVSYRILDQARHRTIETGTPTIIYGAGKAGATAAREMRSNTALGLTPVGFIDDDPDRRGKTLDGYAILGTVEELDAALSRTEARLVVVSSQKIDAARLAQARQICDRKAVRLLHMNIGFHELREPAGELVLQSTEDSGAPTPA